MSSNPTKDRILPVAKKPRIVRKYMCPNCNCQKSFKLEKQWKQHVSASKECFKAVCNVLQDKQTQVLSLTKQTRPRTRSSYAILPTPEANDETMEIDNAEHFMIDDSSDEEVMDDRKPAAVAITYTAAQYHETKLLDLLDGVQAPHYLYQQILEWAHQAKLDKYDFAPERTQSSQIEHLKKLINE